MKNKTKNYVPDFFENAKKVVGKKRFEKSIKEGREMANQLRLKIARERLGLSQVDLKGISQPEVSKIESRKDLKISTLQKYAHAMGMKVQIKLVPEDDDEVKSIAILG